MPAATQHQIREAIRASGASGTAEQVLASITAKTIQVTSDKRYYPKDIAKVFDALGIDGDKLVDSLMDDLRTKGPRYIVDQLNILGADFSDSKMQAKIAQLVNSDRMPASVGNVLRGLGVWMESPLEHSNKIRDLTADLASVQDAMGNLALRSKWTPFVTDIENGIETGTIASWDDVIALAQARL